MNMYQENIMDHFRDPRNFGELKNPDIQFHDSNPLCGDELDWYAKVSDGKLVEIKFKADGCAISKAAASMLVETLEGKDLKDILKIDNQEIFDMLGVELSAMRVKCALLGLKSLQKAIVKYEAEK